MAISPRTPLRPKEWLQDRLAGGPSDPHAYRREWEPKLAPKPTMESPLSQACTYEQTRSPTYRAWCDEMHQPHLTHRSQWEQVYVLRVLHLAGHLNGGRRGLGIEVGTEPIAPCAAKRGAELTITRRKNVGQMDSVEPSWFEICEPAVLKENIVVDGTSMAALGADLTGFDFMWSTGTFSRQAAITRGLDMLRRSLDCLTAGGTAVHTVDYNVSSNSTTVRDDSGTLFRRRDLESLANSLRRDGHKVKLTFGLGDWDQDRHIEEKPNDKWGLKVWHGDFMVTSFGLAITKRG